MVTFYTTEVHVLSGCPPQVLHNQVNLFFVCQLRQCHVRMLDLYNVHVLLRHNNVFMLHAVLSVHQYTGDIVKQGSASPVASLIVLAHLLCLCLLPFQTGITCK